MNLLLEVQFNRQLYLSPMALSIYSVKLKRKAGKPIAIASYNTFLYYVYFMTP